MVGGGAEMAAGKKNMKKEKVKTEEILVYPPWSVHSSATLYNTNQRPSWDEKELG